MVTQSVGSLPEGTGLRLLPHRAPDPRRDLVAGQFK